MSINKLCIIPARGGSKRIPRKNIKDFLGKPIIAYSIEAALNSGLFNEVMVSTDDHEIAEISKKYGAEIPFLRSKENSNDFSGLAEVVMEVIDNYRNINLFFDYICCILPTAPFLDSEELKKANFKFVNLDANALIPVVKFEYPIQRAFTIKDEYLKMEWPENYIMRSQDLENFYHDAGLFYFIKTEQLFQHKKLLVPKSTFMIYNQLMTQDIDTEEDWTIAEIKYTNRFIGEK